MISGNFQRGITIILSVHCNILLIWQLCCQYNLEHLLTLFYLFGNPCVRQNVILEGCTFHTYQLEARNVNFQQVCYAKINICLIENRFTLDIVVKDLLDNFVCRYYWQYFRISNLFSILKELYFKSIENGKIISNFRKLKNFQLTEYLVKKKFN